jgi:hypothetical protein
MGELPPSFLLINVVHQRGAGASLFLFNQGLAGLAEARRVRSGIEIMWMHKVAYRFFSQP